MDNRRETGTFKGVLQYRLKHLFNPMAELNNNNKPPSVFSNVKRKCYPKFSTRPITKPSVVKQNVLRYMNLIRQPAADHDLFVVFILIDVSRVCVYRKEIVAVRLACLVC